MTLAANDSRCKKPARHHAVRKGIPVSELVDLSMQGKLAMHSSIGRDNWAELLPMVQLAYNTRSLCGMLAVCPTLRCLLAKQLMVLSGPLLFYRVNLLRALLLPFRDQRGLSTCHDALTRLLHSSWCLEAWGGEISQPQPRGLVFIRGLEGEPLGPVP